MTRLGSRGVALAWFRNDLIAAWGGYYEDAGIYCSAFDGSHWDREFRFLMHGAALGRPWPCTTIGSTPPGRVATICCTRPSTG
jgi:hypothetical protein